MSNEKEKQPEQVAVVPSISSEAQNGDEQPDGSPKADALENGVSSVEMAPKNLRPDMHVDVKINKMAYVMDQMQTLTPSLLFSSRKDGKAEYLSLANFTAVQMRAFHITWMTFFLCFFGWFGLAPLLTSVQEDLGLTRDQVVVTNQAAVSMTILCRIAIGYICDIYGPRRTYTALLFFGAFPVMFVSFVQSFTELLICRLLIGFIGASFVITQYHTSVMFAPNCVGLANATSAGWGNLGGGVSNAIMPQLAALMVLIFPSATPTNAWRYATYIPGILMLFFSVLYFKITKDGPFGNLNNSDTDDDVVSTVPEGSFVESGDEENVVEKPAHLSPSVDSIKLTPGADSFKSSPKAKEVEATVQVLVISPRGTPVMVSTPTPKVPITLKTRALVFTDYRVYILMFAYACCFGVELIMLSQTSLYFQKIFGTDQGTAGAVVLAFSCANLFARSLGGFVSDRVASRNLHWRVYILTFFMCCEGFVIVLFSRISSLPALVCILFIFGILTMICEGSTFGVVPFINRDCLGLVAGCVGAGGNIGAVLGLFLFQFGIPWQDSFLYLGIIVICASLLVLGVRFPKDVLEDFKKDMLASIKSRQSAKAQRGG